MHRQFRLLGVSKQNILARKLKYIMKPAKTKSRLKVKRAITPTETLANAHKEFLVVSKHAFFLPY